MIQANTQYATCVVHQQSDNIFLGVEFRSANHPENKLSWDTSLRQRSLSCINSKIYLETGIRCEQMFCLSLTENEDLVLLIY